MKKNKLNIQALLRQYIDGSISKNDRHELEKLALDDPLLFEAMEGYAIEEASNAKSDLIEIQKSLRPTQRNNRILPLRWFSVAAGILLIAVIGFLVRPQMNTTKSEVELATYEIAKEKPLAELKVITEESIDLEEISRELKNEKLERASLKSNEILGNDQMGSNKKIKESQKRTNSIKQADIEESEEIVKTEVMITNSEDYVIDGVAIQNQSATASQKEPKNTSESPIENYQDDKNRELAQDEIFEREPRVGNMMDVESESDFSASSKTKRSAPQTFKPIVRGKVIDSGGNALIGASVFFQGNPNGTLTDLEGKFELKADLDKLEQQQKLEISYTGYQSIAVEPIMEREMVFQMKEAQALSEVIVSGKMEAEMDNQKEISPLKGIDHFYEFVYGRFVKTDACQLGKVDCLLTIGPEGLITNIDIIDQDMDSCLENLRESILTYPDKWNQSEVEDKTVKLSFEIK